MIEELVRAHDCGEASSNLVVRLSQPVSGRLWPHEDEEEAGGDRDLGQVPQGHALGQADERAKLLVLVELGKLAWEKEERK